MEISSKVQIIVTFVIDDDFYVGEGLSKDKRRHQYEEDFRDIEVLQNNIPMCGYSVGVEII